MAASPILPGGPAPVADRLPAADRLVLETQGPTLDAADPGQMTSPDADSDAPMPGPYLVVPETADFHGTDATAQTIPTVPYAGVEGAFAPGDRIDLYRVELGAGSLALRLATAYDQTVPAPPLRLLIFNALGRLIASGTPSDGVLDVAVSAGHSGLTPGSPVFVGVDSQGPADSAAPVDYRLWFLRVPGVDDSGAADSGAEEGTTPGETVAVVMGPSATTTGNAASGIARAGTGLLGSTPLASSQSPAIAAAPSGGVLTDGTPTRTVVTTARGVDEPGSPGMSAWDGLRPPLDVEVRRGVAEEAGEASPLVALRGPGGFPVLAAAAVGDWHDASGGPDDRAAPVAGPGRSRCPATVPCPAALPVVVAVASAQAASSNDEAADQPDPRVAGVGWVYGMSAIHAPTLDQGAQAHPVTRPWSWWRGRRHEKKRRAGHPFA